MSLNPVEDTSTGLSSISLSTRNGITQILHRNQLIDIWRLLHPTEKDYTFYSLPHKSYSRIDLSSFHMPNFIQYELLQ